MGLQEVLILECDQYDTAMNNKTPTKQFVLYVVYGERRFYLLRALCKPADIRQAPSAATYSDIFPSPVKPHLQKPSARGGSFSQYRFASYYYNYEVSSNANLLPVIRPPQ